MEASVGISEPASLTALLATRTFSRGGSELHREEVIGVELVTRMSFDYAGRADGQPVYVGITEQGVAASDPAWIVWRVGYDVEGRMVDRQVLTGAWDDRASLGWS